MSEHQLDTKDYVFAEAEDVSMRGMEENYPQTTIGDTGWSKEEKERMKALGYDGLDMIRAWHS